MVEILLRDQVRRNSRRVPPLILPRGDRWKDYIIAKPLDAKKGVYTSTSASGVLRIPETGLGIERDERPVRFWLGGRLYQLQAVLDQWYDPASISYKVRAEDANLYILKQRTSAPDGEWGLVSFRQTR